MSSRQSEAPFAYHGLERIFHEKARLGIVSSLISQADGVAFSDLKLLCDLTDGNLSRHLQVLEEAGYVLIKKGFEGKRRCTHCSLSELGRQRFLDYLDVLEHVLHEASAARAKDEDGMGCDALPAT